MHVLTRRRGFTLIELLVVIAIIAVMAAILSPVMRKGSKYNAQRSSCQSNLKQMGLAFLQYTQDYDERWPLVASHAVSRGVTPFATPFGWADSVEPYIKSTQIFQCPSEKNRTPGVDAVQVGFTDYWMNLNMSRVQSKYLLSPMQTILCGDGNDGRDGTDARYNRNVLPQFWLDDEESPARRHLGTMNILFAAGYVKAIRAERITTGSPLNTHANTQAYTFATK